MVRKLSILKAFTCLDNSRMLATQTDSATSTQLFHMVEQLCYVHVIQVKDRIATPVYSIYIAIYIILLQLHLSQ